MPKLKHKPPSYSLHKASGQAVVRIDGRSRYLGKYGSPESHAAYRRLVTEWSTTKRPLATPKWLPEDVRADLRINELLVAYLNFAEEYYVKNGRPTGEFGNMKDAIRPLQELYETTRVWEFGPAALRTVREQMIADNLSRKVVNARINRVRRIFKWGVENELVDPSVLQGLQSVTLLKEGRSKARENRRVKPVSQEHIEAALAWVTRPVQAMIKLQLATGMRPGEVVLMRACDIDMSGKIWVYTPASHKTEHHGIERTIYIGPKAQKVISPFLKRDLTAYLLNPREAVEELRKRRKAERKTKRYGPKPKRKASPRKKPGEHYTSASYCYAIHKACKKAKIPCWGPNKLRHNAATFLRKQYGIEAARVILGHSSAAITEVYAEMDRTKAAAIMAEIG